MRPGGPDLVDELPAVHGRALAVLLTPSPRGRALLPGAGGGQPEVEAGNGRVVMLDDKSRVDHPDKKNDITLLRWVPARNGGCQWIDLEEANSEHRSNLKLDEEDLCTVVWVMRQSTERKKITDWSRSRRSRDGS